MCVIALVEYPDKRPTELEIRKMWKANPYGGGLAWREEGRVHFAKGLELDQMIARIARLPVPFIAHFRVPSTGGSKPALTHPFLIDHESPIVMEGATDKWVLFHNGTWSQWEYYSKDWLIRAGGAIKQPLGPWSDSRAMAFWAHQFGLGIFEKPWPIDEKVIVFGPGDDDIEMFGDGWSTYDDRYIVSNKYWVDKKVEKEKEADGNKITQSNSMFRPESMEQSEGTGENQRHQHQPRIRIETGNERTGSAADPNPPRGGRKRTPPSSQIAGVASTTIHPFNRAREEYETAIIAWTLGEGSKNALKRTRKAFEKQCQKHKGMAQECLKDTNFKKTLEILEIHQHLLKSEQSGQPTVN